MTQIITTSLALLALTLTAKAQAWSWTASAPVPGTASASVNDYSGGSSGSTTTTLPAGPAPTGLFGANGAWGYSSGYARATWARVPSTAALAIDATLSVGGTARTSGAGSTFAGGSMTATIDMLVQAPAATAGRLFVQYQASQSIFGSPTTIEVDIAADGIVDLTASVAGQHAIDLPIAVGPNGVVIRLGFHALGAAVASNPTIPTQVTAASQVTLHAEIRPNEPVVGTHDSTGATASLTATHSATNTVDLALDYPSALLPRILVFGHTPRNVPITPLLTQLIDVDTWFVTPSMTLSLPQLPAGYTLYCQGIVIDASGNLRGSNSIRAEWL